MIPVCNIVVVREEPLRDPPNHEIMYATHLLEEQNEVDSFREAIGYPAKTASYVPHLDITVVRPTGSQLLFREMVEEGYFNHPKPRRPAKRKGKRR